MDDQAAVEPIRLICLKVREQLVDEILVPLEYRHRHTLPPPVADPTAAPGNRSQPPEREIVPAMIRRRREARRLRLAARMLLQIGR
jgi:hypothetical protein